MNGAALPWRAGFARTAGDAERRLVDTLALTPIPLPDALSHRVGAWHHAKVIATARAYRGDRVRYARVVTLESDTLEIANVLCLPEQGWDVPMLGLDLVHVRPDQAVVVADLLPGVPPPDRASRRTGLPMWAEQFFSADAMVRRCGADDVPATIAAALERVDAFIGAIAASPHDQARRTIRARWQDAYCHAHRREDRMLGLLGRMFDQAWAERFIADVLFPVTCADAGEVAVSRLRIATEAAHARVEALTGLMDEPLTRERYGAFLAATGRCAIPLERAVAALLPADAPAWCRARPRALWLAADLAALGQDVPSELGAPVLASAAEALGAAYVLEGSTLGGQVLTRMLGAQLQIHEDAQHYLRSYGAEVAPRWRTFRTYLAATMATSPDVERAVTRGAMKAFELFARAYGSPVLNAQLGDSARATSPVNESGGLAEGSV